eukprot:288401-Prymnesium_polylepis.1
MPSADRGSMVRMPAVDDGHPSAGGRPGIMSGENVWRWSQAIRAGVRGRFDWSPGRREREARALVGGGADKLPRRVPRARRILTGSV